MKRTLVVRPSSAFQKFKRRRDADIRRAFQAGMPVRDIEKKFSVATTTVRRATKGIVRLGGEKYRRPLSPETQELRIKVVKLREEGRLYKEIAWEANVSIGHIGKILAIAGLTRNPNSRHPTSACQSTSK